MHHWTGVLLAEQSFSCDKHPIASYMYIANQCLFHILIKTKGPRAMICSPDKNNYCISANAIQLLSVLPQQLGQKFDHMVQRSEVNLVSSFEQT